MKKLLIAALTLCICVPAPVFAADNMKSAIRGTPVGLPKGAVSTLPASARPPSFPRLDRPPLNLV